MFWFLLKQTKGGLNWENLMNLAPFELELFYYMAINDFKEEHKQEQEQRASSMNQLVSLFNATAKQKK